MLTVKKELYLIPSLSYENASGLDVREPPQNEVSDRDRRGNSTRCVSVGDVVTI